MTDQAGGSAMRPYDIKSEEENLAMESDNYPRDAERWSILNFADKVSLHPPADTDWVGWVEIPRDQFNAIVDWYIKDQAPPATDQMVAGDISREALKKASIDMLQATGWKPGNRFSFHSVSELMTALALTQVGHLVEENARLRKAISGCDWYWPEDDTSSDACADGPWQIAENCDVQPGEVFGYSRGGIIETRYYGFLEAADDADSDDQFEADEATREAAEAKIAAEVSRRAALSAPEAEG